MTAQHIAPALPARDLCTLHGTEVTIELAMSLDDVVVRSPPGREAGCFLTCTWKYSGVWDGRMSCEFSWIKERLRVLEGAVYA